jgi:hypothetical protein
MALLLRAAALSAAAALSGVVAEAAVAVAVAVPAHPATPSVLARPASPLMALRQDRVSEVDSASRHPEFSAATNPPVRMPVF